MPDRCLLYYITGRQAFPGDEFARRRRLLEKIAEATRARVDYIQLREKDLPARELESLARDAMRIIHKLRTENREMRTRFLINSRTDVALATGADGVHLRSDDLSLRDVRAIWQCGAGGPSASSGQAPAREIHDPPIIAVSCHSPSEVAQAADAGANFAVFAPVFEKKNTHISGLAALRKACRAAIPVLALGGVTLENASSCLEVGAAGIAAIRLFQENDVADIVRHLRGR